LPRRHFFIRPAVNPIIPPPSLHSFGGEFHCRDAISSFGRQHHRATISSFVRPAHRSPRRNHFSGPANPIADEPFQRAGESHRRATIFLAGWLISSPRRYLFCGLANPIAAPPSFQRAGESHHRAAIISVVRRIPLRAAFFSAGRKISLPRRNLFSGPANPIPAPQSFQWAGVPHRRAAIFSAGRRISSPRRNHFSGLANPIAVPHSFPRAGKSHHRATIFSAGRRATIFQRAGESHCHAAIFSAGWQIQSFQRASAFLRQAAKSHLDRRIIANCASINLLYLNSF